MTVHRCYESSVFGLVFVTLVAATGCQRSAADVGPEPAPATPAKRQGAEGTISGPNNPAQPIFANVTMADLTRACSDRLGADGIDGGEGALEAKIRSEVQQKAKVLRLDEVACRRTLCKMVMSAPTRAQYNAEFALLISPTGSLTSSFGNCLSDYAETPGKFSGTTYCSRPPHALPTPTTPAP